MKHRMLPFYLLTPSVFAVVSGLGLNFHPASGMEEETEEREEKRRGASAQISSKGQLSPVLEEDREEDGDEEGFLKISRDLFPSNLEEVLTLSDIRKALNYSPDIKELINPPRRVEFQTYVEALMRRMMQVTGWKIQSSSALSSSYFYADESAVSEALKRERERVLTLKGRAAQKLQIFISQMENLERFLRDTTQTSMPKNEHPSLMPDDIEKTTAWMGGASYLTHSTHLAFLVAPDAIEETLEIFGLLQRAFEKLQSAYTLLSTTLSAKVIDPILKSRLLSVDRKSPLQAWGQLLKVNQEYYEQKTTADLQEPIDAILRGRELLSISPTPSALPSVESSAAKKAEFSLSSVQEEENSLPIDLLSPVSSEGDKFIFEMGDSDEDAHPTGVIAPPSESAELPSARRPGDMTVNPSQLAQAEITSLKQAPTLDPDLDNELDFINVVIGPDGEFMAPPSDDENNFEEIPRVPSEHLTDLAPAIGDSTSAASENRPHPASPALVVQNDLSVPVDASAVLSSPSDVLSVHAPTPVSGAIPVDDGENELHDEFEQVLLPAPSDSSSHPQDRSPAGSPALDISEVLPVSGDASADLTSLSNVIPAPTLTALVSGVPPVEDPDNELVEVSSSNTASAPHSPARSLAGSPTVNLDDQGQEIEAPSGNPLTPSFNIFPDAIIAPPTVLQPQPLQGAAASDDTITEDNKGDVVFVSTVDHESANRALAAQLAAALAEFEEFKRQASLQLSTAEALAQKQLEAEKQQRLLAEQTTQQEKQRRLAAESFLNVDDRLQTQVALEMLGNNFIQPIQDMITDFQKKVVAPILASLDDLKSSFSENPEVDQTIIASIRSNVEHIQNAGLESIQSVIDAFKSSFQESKHYLLEPTALLAKAHELVEQIVMAFKDTAAPQKSAIGSSVAPFETLQKFSYGPGLGLTQIGMPLSFALIPQESTLLPVGHQTTPPLRIPTLGTASTSSSISGSVALTGLPSTRGSTPSVGTTLQVLSSKAQEITPAMRAWNAQMNRQLQTVHESVNRMTALHKITKVRNRKNFNVAILLASQA